jgi:hypothetical protein
VKTKAKKHEPRRTRRARRNKKIVEDKLQPAGAGGNFWSTWIFGFTFVLFVSFVVHAFDFSLPVSIRGRNY